MIRKELFPNTLRVFFIFCSVFSAGIASLQMELSVLREATFIFGSTAFTNSLIISTFLAGLAIGSYFGNLLVRIFKQKAVNIFVISQCVQIITIVFFVFSKNIILYRHYFQFINIMYFLIITLIPSIVGGMSFSLFLNMLYSIGEKHIAFVYAISTAGNVVSGLLHGLFFVPYLGMISTYVTAIITSALSIYFISKFQKFKFRTPFYLTATSCLAILLLSPVSAYVKNGDLGNFTKKAFKRFNLISDKILWSKDDKYGLVQIKKINKDSEGCLNGNCIDLYIHNLHNCRSTFEDIAWHDSSVSIPMALLDSSSKRILILGYCSGSTVAKALEYDNVSQVTSIEINEAVLEAARIFFPSFHNKNSKDKRSEIILGEFRSWLKKQSHNRKYDIVILDISIEDPYYSGMFTTEFFNEIYQHLNTHGVVFFHYPALVRTAAEIFDHIYCPKYKSPDTYGFYFFTNYSIEDKFKDFLVEIFPKNEPGIVYTDHKVYRY